MTLVRSLTHPPPSRLQPCSPPERREGVEHEQAVREIAWADSPLSYPSRQSPSFPSRHLPPVLACFPHPRRPCLQFHLPPAATKLRLRASLFRVALAAPSPLPHRS